MKFNYLLIFFYITSNLYCIEISPYISYEYNKDTDLYPNPNISLSHYDIGFTFAHKNENMLFKSNISYHLYDCLNARPNDFNKYQGFGTIENSPGLSSNQFNYFFADLYFQYTFNKIQLYFGRYNPIWGIGESKIFLSAFYP